MQTYALDMNDFAAINPMLDMVFATLQRVDISLIAHGTLPDQSACQRELNTALREFSNNGLSVIALLTLLGNRLELQRHGSLAVISSVAGDRGRPSNYLYGTAKAAVTTFCEGLRSRLFKAGVHVLTIKPGLVDTPMTQGLPLPKVLVATPERVARDILSAIYKKKDSIYTPAIWAGVMLIICNLPRVIFKRISL
ncbi:putative oxidoreductase [compost metagenome]